MGALFCFNTAYGQSGPEIETITINPHEDVRIVFEQLKEKNFKHGKYTYYHRNIKIVEGNYLAGKKHGKWQRFFQDGTISIDAFYLQDKKHGNWIYYFKDKTKEDDGRWIDFDSFKEFEKVLYKLAGIPRKDKKSAYLMSPASYLEVDLVM